MIGRFLSSWRTGYCIHEKEITTHCPKCSIESRAEARAEGAAQERKACLKDYVDLVSETPPSKHVTPLALCMRFRARGEAPKSYIARCTLDTCREQCPACGTSAEAHPYCADPWHMPAAPKCATCGGTRRIDLDEECNADCGVPHGLKPCPDCAPKPDATDWCTACQRRMPGLHAPGCSASGVELALKALRVAQVYLAAEGYQAPDDVEVDGGFAAEREVRAAIAALEGQGG